MPKNVLSVIIFLQQCKLQKFAVNITENWNISGSRDVLILIILGVVFGLTGRFFSALLQKAKKLFGEKITDEEIDALKKLKDNGEYDKIYAKWFGEKKN